MEKGQKHHSLECFPYFVSSKKSFIHYTCNSPSIEILNKYEINPIGKSFGCLNETEVLEIPLEVYKSQGFRGIPKKEVLTLNLEKLIRNLK